ncbi:replication initiation protein [Acinetobacter terrestris]|uniref:Replication initiation protein n=1 Tax=Acinetobacter terrestris TaxID=2529843 RepID=A0AAW6UTM2_9GAMM|nr:replication initiation protein [Acinetobacter terrestris]MDK1685023.1 replication initiation protein [Acinetobacter terrestris]
MIKTATAFNLRKKVLKFEEKQTRQSDLDEALRIFRLSIPDTCPLWTSKIALAGEKPCWFHKDEPEFAKFSYLKTASDFKTGTLIIDIDQAIADHIEAIIYTTLDAPVPNLIIKNPANKHVQLVYCLKNWVCIDVSNRKGNYSASAHSLYKAIKKRLNDIFGGDDAYHNFIAKNPYSKQWNVIGLRSTAWEMYELASVAQLKIKKTTFIERLQSKQSNIALKNASARATVAKGERNEFLFNTVRKRAYTLYNQYVNEWTREQFENCINDFANELNEAKCSPPLQPNEISIICHSIVSYCYGSFGQQRKYTQSELSEIASKCGKKGGKAKGYKYSQQRQEARRLHKRGKKAKDIALITGLSIRAVYNAINQEKKPKTALKQQKNSVQKNEEKTIIFHKFNHFFCANSYQCSVLFKKELRSNSHLVCERSEPKVLISLLKIKDSHNIYCHKQKFIPFVYFPLNHSPPITVSPTAKTSMHDSKITKAFW